MPSVVGLLEQRECAARRRVDELREEADRIHAELSVAERDWNSGSSPARVSARYWPPARVTSPVLMPLWTCRMAVNSRCPPGLRNRRSRSRWCRCGVRGWSGRRCRCTTNASCVSLPTATDLVKVLFPARRWPSASAWRWCRQRWKRCGRRRSGWWPGGGCSSRCQVGSRSRRPWPDTAGHGERRPSDSQGFSLRVVADEPVLVCQGSRILGDFLRFAVGHE